MQQQLQFCFPSVLMEDVQVVVNTLKADSKPRFDDSHVIVQGEKLTLLSRMYFYEPPDEVERGFTARQRLILNCIFLRHHNGFVRQKRLEALIGETDSFIIPFTFPLLGEYVDEILELLNDHIDRNLQSYTSFIIENPAYWRLTQARIVSYWNAYYRREFPNINDYIGKKILDRLAAALIT